MVEELLGICKCVDVSSTNATMMSDEGSGVSEEEE